MIITNIHTHSPSAVLPAMRKIKRVAHLYRPSWPASPPRPADDGDLFASIPLSAGIQRTHNTMVNKIRHDLLESAVGKASEIKSTDISILVY